MKEVIKDTYTNLEEIKKKNKLNFHSPNFKNILFYFSYHYDTSEWNKLDRDWYGVLEERPRSFSNLVKELYKFDWENYYELYEEKPHFYPNKENPIPSILRDLADLIEKGYVNIKFKE